MQHARPGRGLAIDLDVISLPDRHRTERRAARRVRHGNNVPGYPINPASVVATLSTSTRDKSSRSKTYWLGDRVEPRPQPFSAPLSYFSLQILRGSVVARR